MNTLLTAETLLRLLGAVFVGAAVRSYLDGDRASGLGYATASSVTATVHDVLRRDGYVYVDAGCAALLAWMWWNSGGGDGTRRRIRGWLRAFRGVRRTAPVSAS